MLNKSISGTGTGTRTAVNHYGPQHCMYLTDDLKNVIVDLD
jgi:hypothetical protein